MNRRRLFGLLAAVPWAMPAIVKGAEEAAREAAIHAEARRIVAQLAILDLSGVPVNKALLESYCRASREVRDLMRELRMMRNNHRTGGRSR